MNALNADEKKYYQRHLVLPHFGEAAQLAMKQASVLVVGAGGLGCPVLSYLAGSGVGNITIIDPDQVSVSNLHRQVLFNEDDIGKNKAERAAAKIGSVNPHIQVQPLVDQLSIYNAISLVKKHDLIIDGSDNFPTRYLVNDACVMGGKPFVSGAIHQFSGQLSVFNYQGGPTYRCLFPAPPPAHEVPACDQAGVLGVLPGIIGTLMAIEAIKVITGTGQVLRGKFMTYDVLSCEMNIFGFKLHPGNLHITELENREHPCPAFPEIGAGALKELLQQKNPPVLIDVREPEEYRKVNMGGSNIPLAQLSDSELPFHTADQVVVICSGSVRSRAAGAILKARGFHHITLLKGGLNGMDGN